MIIRIEYGLQSNKKYYLFFNPEKEFFTITPTKIIFTQDEIEGTDSLNIKDINEIEGFMIEGSGDRYFYDDFKAQLIKRGGLK